MKCIHSGFGVQGPPIIVFFKIAGSVRLPVLPEAAAALSVVLPILSCLPVAQGLKVCVHLTIPKKLFDWESCGYAN
jgi:hypothetical protein